MGHFISTNDTAIAEANARLFFDLIVTIHAIPTTLISDRDPQFMKYEVERVLTHRRRRDTTREFLIRFKGYDPSEDSWVAEADMGNACHALKDYL
ncbi:unnamed protein product, partial [Closterium sp. NIES-54]